MTNIIQVDSVEASLGIPALRKKFLKCVVCLGLVMAFFRGFAQDNQANNMKARITYKFAQNVEWPGENELAEFTFGVLTDTEAIAKAFTDRLSKGKIKNKPIRIKRFFRIADITGVQVLYVDPFFSLKIQTIAKELESKPILIVSNQASDKRSVMINFHNDNNLLKFEINKANILNASLKIGPSLILLGGTEIDVAHLYKDTQQSLNLEREKVREQQLELSNMRKEIDLKKAEIEQQQQLIATQKGEIDRQSIEITAQKTEILDQKNTLSNLNDNVLNQQKLLAEKIELLRALVAKISTHESVVKKQESQIRARTNQLMAVSKELDEQQDRIKEQKQVLSQQNTRLKIQQNLIYVFIAFLVLIIALAFVIYKTQRIRYLNRELERKVLERTDEIEQQKQEIEVQRDNLNQMNWEISQQNQLLERKVDERTQELQASNEELNASFDDLVRSNEQVKNSLQEKEVLLAEVHHRVKNNLAVISGLLQMQIFSTDNPSLHRLLRESQSRIKSMALIHEKLYQTSTFAQIEFGGYIRDLIHEIQISYPEKAGSVDINLQLKPISLELNNAIPCGLLLNELLSNAYKHAFVGQEHGQIDIRFGEEEGQYMLVVCDNGIGLSPGINWQQSPTMGMTLIVTLVKQLKGQMEFVTNNGLTFILRFQPIKMKVWESK
jgi:two-component sensor histidine kinase